MPVSRRWPSGCSKAPRPDGRAGDNLWLCRGGPAMSAADPDHRRSGEADRGEEAVAGRTDPRLPRSRAQRSTAELHAFIYLTPSARWPRRGRPKRRSWRMARRARCTASRSGSRTSSTPKAFRPPASRSSSPTTFPTPTQPAPNSLAAAGTVLMGKLTTHEFADGGPSFDLPGRRRATRGTPSISPPAAAAAPARRSLRA